MPNMVEEKEYNDAVIKVKKGMEEQIEKLLEEIKEDVKEMTEDGYIASDIIYERIADFVYVRSITEMGAIIQILDDRGVEIDFEEFFEVYPPPSHPTEFVEDLARAYLIQYIIYDKLGDISHYFDIELKEEEKEKLKKLV